MNKHGGTAGCTWGGSRWLRQPETTWPQDHGLDLTQFEAISKVDPYAEETRECCSPVGEGKRSHLARTLFSYGEGGRIEYILSNSVPPHQEFQRSGLTRDAEFQPLPAGEEKESAWAKHARGYAGYLFPPLPNPTTHHPCGRQKSKVTYLMAGLVIAIIRHYYPAAKGCFAVSFCASTSLGVGNPATAR